MKTMLMVVHEASRTGAPVLALTLLKWLVLRGDMKVDVVVLQPGPLASDFESVTTTYDAQALSGRSSRIGQLMHRLFDFGPRFWTNRGLRKLPRNYDFVYGNSIVALPAVLQLGTKPSVRRVCAVHELTSVIEYFFSARQVRRLLPKADLLVAGSESVSQNLIESYAADPAAIKVIHAFVESNPTSARGKAEMRSLLGIGADELVIGGAGTPTLRKGTDLLPALAKALRERYPLRRFKLLWLGGSADDPMVTELKREASALGVDDVLLFCEATNTPNDYINLYDIFILPSREDPFPLVAVTAALFEKPIVAFEGSGGMTELLADGAGFLAPHLDLDLFAEAIVQVGDSPTLASRVGRAACDRARDKFGSEAGCLALFEAITGRNADGGSEANSEAAGRLTEAPRR